MKLLLAIACGGAIGAVGRHFVAHQVALVMGAAFPFGTLLINVLGSFVMGLLVETMALTWSPSMELRGFLVVGVLGAFTTFSTFSLDAALLYERGALGQACLYILGSVSLSVLGLFFGLWLARSVLT